MRILWRGVTDIDNADKVDIRLVLYSGKYRGIFQVKKELPMGEMLRHPDCPIKCAEIFRDALIEMGDLVLRQVKSGKIVSWDEETGKMVEHELATNWLPE